MYWETKVKKPALGVLEKAGKFLANGGHAQQDIPAQHRLLNAGLMFVGWKAGDVLRDICFGVNQVTEGEYKPIPIEDVPAPLRFLHKSIDWNPHSEEASDQWKKLLHQLMPAVGAAVGAIAGSMYAFERNGRAQKFAAAKAADSLNLMEADTAIASLQAVPLRALAGVFGTFSAASGLTFLYGLFLNASFAAANGAKIFSGSLAHGNAGPAKALESVIAGVSAYAKHAMEHGGEMNPALAKSLRDKVLMPMFGHQLDTPEKQAHALETMKGLLDRAFHKFSESGKSPKEVAEAVGREFKAMVEKGGIDQILTDMGLDIKEAHLGGAIPVVETVTKPFFDLAGKVGFRHTTDNFRNKVKVPPPSTVREH